MLGGENTTTEADKEEEGLGVDRLGMRVRNARGKQKGGKVISTRCVREASHGQTTQKGFSQGG